MKTKWLFLAPLGLLLVLQAFPIDRHFPETNPALALEQVLELPEPVFSQLKNACYDCHSNQTRYPWYAGVQPAGWFIQNHTEVGRSELNFAEFGRWETEDQADLLRHCAKMIKKGAMPLRSYLLLHPEARLDAEQTDQLARWFMERADALEPGNAVMVHRKSAKMVSDTCDDNDANPRCCFVQMPEHLDPVVVKIAPDDEPGQRIRIRGRFYKKDGKTPYANVLFYAYHTDSTGRYTRKGDETGILRWHGRLHGWGRTCDVGNYEIQTIMPAAYPGRSAPAHIHIVVWAPGSEPHYIDDFLFVDDPLLSEKQRADGRKNPGRSPVLTLEKGDNGLLVAKRDIILK